MSSYGKDRDPETASRIRASVRVLLGIRGQIEAIKAERAKLEERLNGLSQPYMRASADVAKLLDDGEHYPAGDVVIWRTGPGVQVVPRERIHRLG